MCLLYWHPVSNLRPCLAKIYCGPSYHRTLPPRLRLAHWLTCPAILPYSGLNLTMLQTSTIALRQIWPTSLSSVVFSAPLLQSQISKYVPCSSTPVSPCVLYSSLCFQNLPSPSFLKAYNIDIIHLEINQTTGQLSKVLRGCRWKTTFYRWEC